MPKTGVAIGAELIVGGDHELDARFVVKVEAAEGDAVADVVADAPRAVRLAGEVPLAQGGVGGAEGVLAVVPAARSQALTGRPNSGEPRVPT